MLIITLTRPDSVPAAVTLALSFIFPLLIGFLLVKMRASDVATLTWLAGLVWFMIVGLWILDMPTGPGSCYHCGAGDKLWLTFFSLNRDSGMVDGQGRFLGTWPAAAMIGYSVGALLGTLTAAPERRHILFVGDGSFQVTAQELSTILRHDHKPVIFLINNGGYTIERGYLGKTEPYNDVANWAYADLPKVFRRDTSARSFLVKTNRDLQNALSAPNDTLIFVESIMDPYDALAPITNSSNKGADLNYGPRGPQHRENLQLRPAK